MYTVVRLCGVPILFGIDMTTLCVCICNIILLQNVKLFEGHRTRVHATRQYHSDVPSIPHPQTQTTCETIVKYVRIYVYCIDIYVYIVLKFDTVYNIRFPNYYYIEAPHHPWMGALKRVMQIYHVYIRNSYVLYIYNTIYTSANVRRC